MVQTSKQANKQHVYNAVTLTSVGLAQVHPQNGKWKKLNQK